MSEANVEIVRRWMSPHEGEDLVPLMQDAVERFGPEFPPDSILAYWAEDPGWQYVHPKIEWTSKLPGLSRTASGPRQLAVWWTEFVDVWESYTYSTVELRDLGDWVLHVADVSARGRQGIDVKMRVFELAQVRDERVAVYRAAFLAEEEALEAVGLAG